MQAFPRPDTHHRHSRTPEGSSSGDAAAGYLLDSMLTVQPHALDDHVPALCGPLQAGDPPQPPRSSTAAPSSPVKLLSDQQAFVRFQLQHVSTAVVLVVAHAVGCSTSHDH